MTEERRLPHDPDLDADEDASGSPLPVHLTPHLIGLVFVGGFLGVLGRALLDRQVPDGGGFPATTFTINISGALLLAVLLEVLAHRGPDAGHRRRLRLLLGTGVLSGFTTYSAVAAQADALVRAGQAPIALGYVASTLIVGLVASVAGIALTRRWLAR